MNLREKLSEIDALDLGSVDFENLKSLITDATVGDLYLHREILPPGDLRFRVSDYLTERPEDIDQIGPPPPEKAGGFQRCNREHDPMFYASSSGTTAMMEMGLDAGQTVYLSVWRLRRPLSVFGALGNRRMWGLNTRFSPEQKDYFRFFLKKFTEEVGDDFSYRYKLTAAFAELYTNGWDPLEAHIHTTGKVGITYRSVAHNGFQQNVALSREIYLDYYEPIQCVELSITDQISKNPAGFRLTGIADIVPANTGFALHWKEAIRSDECIQALSLIVSVIDHHDGPLDD
ncbi:hypothetical protein VWY03_05200 [Phaeobacter sp. JH20_09]|uniref:hypothetical protein n=1 Tax=unclassified Phaeobacter TaxID=2621772 RepID=UPI003A8A72C3